MPSKKVHPPRLAASPVHLECVLQQTVTLGRDDDHHLVLGRIVHIGADDAVLDAKGNVDPDKLTFVGRMGGTTPIRQAGSRWPGPTRPPTACAEPDPLREGPDGKALHGLGIVVDADFHDPVAMRFEADDAPRFFAPFGTAPFDDGLVQVHDNTADEVLRYGKLIQKRTMSSTPSPM